MSRSGKLAIWITAIGAAAGGLAIAVLLRHSNKRKPLLLEGAVVSQATQPDKELPLSNVDITVSDDLGVEFCKSDSSGFFKLTLPASHEPSEPIVLQFRHTGYRPLDLNVADGNGLYVARMVPTRQQANLVPNTPQVTISNISIRYSVKTMTAVNEGSSVKTFQVVNTGNVPCNHRQPCSPDGKWKAATGSVSLDAGNGNAFRNARVSCIAGPCPFTKITSQGFSLDKSTLNLTAIDWSDTATFLVEAEVFHPMVSDEVRKSYPAIFGRVLDFSVPSSAEGVCIEADVGGSAIIFPLGPNPVLQWADCHARETQNKTEAYRCELTPGYRF